MITIVDYGMGNLNSILYKLNRHGIEAIVTSDKDLISNSSKLIIPGVGHFAKAMSNLEKLDLINVLNEHILVKKKPVLGICLGMQLLTKHSEEGNCAGLGYIDAVTKKFSFPKSNKLKVPHVGWNLVNFKSDCVLRNDISQEYYYFTHSYYVECKLNDEILSSTNYGIEFTSSFVKDNIVATQFHPEKSHITGFQIIINFVKYFD